LGGFLALGDKVGGVCSARLVLVDFLRLDFCAVRYEQILFAIGADYDVQGYVISDKDVSGFWSPWTEDVVCVGGWNPPCEVFAKDVVPWVCGVEFVGMVFGEESGMKPFGGIVEDVWGVVDLPLGFWGGAAA
jgi:hypothetical protein